MADGIVLRLNVENADNDSLADAYSRMQALTGTDNRSWIYWAGYHGFSQYLCWHHSGVGDPPASFPYDLFLPWHRAYLHYWENVARDQNASAVLAWWDWSSDLSHSVGIPSAYSQPQLASGDAHPLFSGPTPDMPNDAARRTTRAPGDPATLPLATDLDPSHPARDANGDLSVEALLQLNDFTDFSSQLQDVHDQVHGWVGGDMANIPVAAFDPIFWAHHTMIDRIWYLWQLRHGMNNLPPDYLPRVLEPFGLTVQDVLDVHRLGYDYADASTSVVIAPGSPDTAAPEPGTPEPGTPEPGTPDTAAPDPGTPDPGTPDPGTP
jgi:tyrosinase